MTDFELQGDFADEPVNTFHVYILKNWSATDMCNNTKITCYFNSSESKTYSIGIHKRKISRNNLYKLSNYLS